MRIHAAEGRPLFPDVVRAVQVTLIRSTLLEDNVDVLLPRLHTDR
ncbi:hypothetical protein [Streptomyces platensis]